MLTEELDYYPYAMHDLIDTTFAAIKSRVNKKDWIEAFYAIEALTIFFEFESDWTSSYFSSSGPECQLSSL